jgi:hypothetical protein
MKFLASLHTFKCLKRKSQMNSCMGTCMALEHLLLLLPNKCGVHLIVNKSCVHNSPTRTGEKAQEQHKLLQPCTTILPHTTILLGATGLPLFTAAICTSNLHSLGVRRTCCSTRIRNLLATHQIRNKSQCKPDAT